MVRVYLAVIVAILCGSLAPVRAENASSSFSLTAAAGGFGASPGLGLRLGYDITGRGMADSFGVEGSTLVKWADRGNAHLLRIEVLVPVAPGKRLVPFLAAGPGAISGNAEDGFALSLAFGGGVKYFISDNLALRGDLRDMLVSGQKPSANNLEYTVGLSWIFGKKEWSIEDLEKKNAAGEASLPYGATSQGRDNQSPAEITVTARTGKPGGNPAALPGDNREKGEKTAAFAAGKEAGAASVAPTGAIPGKAEPPGAGSAGPGDTSKPEMVPPATKVPQPGSDSGGGGKSRQQPVPVAAGGHALSGAQVGAALLRQPGQKEALPAACRELGSAPRQDGSVRESTANFALNKADLSPSVLRRLRTIADYLMLNPGTRAVIDGHTDSTGPLRYNLELSRRRAASVKRYLVQLGIAPSRLVTKGYGPCAPIAGMPPSAAENRRATAVVTLEHAP